MTKRTALIVVAIILLGFLSFGQEPYKLPPKNIIDVLDVPPSPRVSLSPVGGLMAIIENGPMPLISYLSQPILRIGGIRILPANNSRQVLSFSVGLSLKNIKTGEVRKISLPDGIRMTSVSWAPDGRAIVFLRHLETGVELWGLDVRSGTARALTPPVVNTVTAPFSWFPDSRRLIVSLIPDGRGPAPDPPRIPKGPNIQETAGKLTKTATYQDLLKTSFDEILFEYYATAQLAIIDIAGGQAQKIGNSGIYINFSPSPDMSYILVNRVKRPFSYSVPYDDFSRCYEIWDSSGKQVHLLADLPPAENVPINGVPTGPRNVDWIPHRPATLIWAEAMDGGDPETQAPFREHYLTLGAPFQAEPREVLKLKERAAGLTHFSTPGLALASESIWKRRWRTTYLVDLDRPEIAPKKIFDLSTRDRYNNPGAPVTTTHPTGEQVILQDKDWIYLDGSGASPRGDYPFLDRMNVRSLKKERLFQCQDSTYEAFVDFDGASRSRIITRFETSSQPPNFYLLDLKTKKRKALTDFTDPAQQFSGVRKELIKYKREDGVELSGTLYLPAGHQPGQRLPAVVWAYPLEYSDQATAGQVRSSVNRFTSYRGASHLFFVTQGYAILDGAEMPVIGDPKTVNDTYVQQIVANARAAVRALDELGIADPKRIGVGGHSYGAFMTANLLAHCDYFAAGIARSGAYNRTLTPFGFQSERRTLWEALETYIKMSPFMHADKINEPILLIHGEADNNSGTFPIQSERLFAALKGFGATARLVMLPNESHGYSARESVLHALAEMIEWFDKYVKNRS